MKQKNIIIILAIFFLTLNLSAQTAEENDEDFQNALKAFVNDNLLSFGRDAIAQERFLIEQMRLINFEIKSRVTNIDDVREKYFEGLQRRLVELQALKGRINTGGSTSLNAFVDKLEQRIKQTIDEGRINYRRQKVFEDGLQLLYVAEEMLNLDPNASVGGDATIRNQLQSSQQQLLSSFGETGQATFSSPGTTGKATIFDLFREWKLTNALKFELRWTDVQIIKKRLLKSGTALEQDRIFKRELRSAVMAYNFRNFDLADRLFDEIISRYTFVSTTDDIFYYQGDANYRIGRYEKAEIAFLALVQNFPTSSFAASAYSKLIKIAHHYNQPEKVRNYYSSFEGVTTGDFADYDETRFIAALSAVNNDNFESAVQILNQILPKSQFYIDARYLLAQAYTGAQNLDEAESVLLGLVSGYNLTPDYYFNIYLKLGYIKYEKGEYPLALRYFDRVGGGFSLYDRVIMGYAWTYYKIELAKPEVERDFSLTKRYLNLLIDEFFNSDYLLEAKSLYGYVYQLEQKTNDAIREFDYVFRSNYTKTMSDNNLAEQDRLREELTEIKDQQQEAISKNDRAGFINAKRRYSGTQDSLMRLNYSDLSANSIAARNEVKRIQSQIAELERMKMVAQERNSRTLLNKIEELESTLQEALDDFPELRYNPNFGMNYFDEHPVARKASVLADRDNKILAMRNDALTEKSSIDNQLIQIAADIDRARTRKEYKRLIHLEIKRDKFEVLSKKYDQMLTATYDMELSDSPINLQEWSDYGAFGIANVNYAVKQSKLSKRSYYLEQINKINQILNSRKELLDYKISLIDGEVNFMTRRVRQQERLRERAELDRKFQESYFDTHTSEFEETETVPPVIEEEQ
jgi:TolA-binding protein